MKNALLFLLILLAACKSDQQTIKPVIQNITESVYASGMVKSEDQYQVFASVSGIVNQVFVVDGAPVEIGSPILSIVNDAQNLMMDNARLSADFNALPVNVGKLGEAKSFVILTKNQMVNDLLLLERQRRLWGQGIGAKITLEQRELAYKNSTFNNASAIEKLAELERQLKYASIQSKNNLFISKKTTEDYVVKSKIQGTVYQVNLANGEIVSPQIPIAIIGSDKKYLLEMQVDEDDITLIELAMPVMVVLSSYKDAVFEAVVSRINPIMNVQSKTFTVEAEFVRPPKVLYPNISFEANVLIRTKKNALLLPRTYLLNDSVVINKAGKRLPVKTGLKDYQMVEILSGINVNDEIVLPKQ